MKIKCRFCKNEINAFDLSSFGNKTKKYCHIECFESVGTYARNYHNPISDFEGFLSQLKHDSGLTANKEDIAYILGFTEE